MGLLDALFRSDEVLGIAEETMDFAREAAAAAHPNEYMALLRGTPASDLGLDRSGQVITDVLVIPGTTSSPTAATMKGYVVPNDRKAIGSVHSHPNGVIRPSEQDLRSFGKGEVHIIIGAPYERDDWRAFDRSGDEIDLEVLSVTLPEPRDFFEFSQADIDVELEQ